MGSQSGTIDATVVSYHRDNPFGNGRPAINVKVSGALHPSAIYNLIEDTLGEETAQEIFNAADEVVRMEFWDENLPRMAAVLGFEVEQAGHMGGWVEITNADPLGLEGEERRDFLSRYRQLREFCDREVAEYKQRVERMSQNIAIEAKLAGTVTVREIVSFDGEFKAGVIKLAESMGFQPA